MKLLVLAAFVAAVVSLRHGDDSHPEGQSPWQAGKVYQYEVSSHTLARLQEGPSTGSAFKATLSVRAKTPYHIQIKLENPQHAQVHQQMPDDVDEHTLPDDLQYQPVSNLDKPLEVKLENGHVVTLSLPASLPVSHENLVKGLLSGLQVDLSTHRNIHSSRNYYDKENHNGLFRKMEADVTGECETLYSVSPLASEWRRELPQFANEEDPIQITKSKNYEHCYHRISYHFGIPYNTHLYSHHGTKEQFIRRSTISRILAAKTGQIYKSETTSTVHVHPQLYGEQKAQVHSYVQMLLKSVQPDQEQTWQQPENQRIARTLVYAVTEKQIAVHDSSSSSSSSESHSYERIHILPDEPKHRTQRSVHAHSHSGSHSSSSSSSSSSSASVSTSAFRNDFLPSDTEPVYTALYMSHQMNPQTQKQGPVNAQKLLQDIAQQLQNPNNMPKADFLAKFNILVRLLASMSSEQLTQTSRSIEVGKSSNNNIKVDMWMIFRDAVTQAGTLPAFHLIKTWIQTKKIQGEEAAQVVTSLATTIRYPTKQVMKQFFELAQSPEVKEHEGLQAAVLLSSTKLINMAHVNNDTAHSYYPTHMYGRITPKHDTFVLDEILPSLSASLKKAIESQDSSQAQLYILAISNVGHPQILVIFKPYLEGTIKTTTYLRTKMILALRPLTFENDKCVRAVLFDLLTNTAEPYEVRAAAIITIFNTHPSVPMMQTMAHMTHDDPSIQIRASLKYALETVAELKEPHYRHLSQAAKAAKWMVTREEFGAQDSMKEVFDGYASSDDIRIVASRAQISSDDSIIPKYLRAYWQTSNADWTKDESFSASFSSVKEFYNVLTEMFVPPRSKSQATHKYSAEKIAQMLNINFNSEEPLEAAFHFELLNQQRYYPLGQEEILQLIREFKEYMEKVKSGVVQHYTKVLNQEQVSVMFPIASGVPFVYKYKKPTLIHIQGELKGPMNFPTAESRDFTAHMNKDVQFTYAKNVDGVVGFIDHIGDRYPHVGVVTKVQVNLPVKLEVTYKPSELKFRMEPLRPDQDQTVFHYSVWPYVANQKKDTLVTVSQDPTTKVVERPRKVMSFDYKFGQSTGNLLHFQGYTYSLDYKNLDNVFKHPDLMSQIAAAFEQRDIAMTHFNFRYLSKQSQNKALTLTFVYDELHNQKQSGELGAPTKQSDYSPNSPSRREDLLKRVAAGINTANAYVVDLSASFEGPQKADFIVTAALGHSPVDKKIQYAFFAGKNTAQGPSQLYGVGTVVKPEINRLNFVEALSKDLKTTFNAEVKYGQDGHVNIEGHLDRTQKYAEDLKNEPFGKECIAEIARSQQYQGSCQKAILMANAPDHLQVSVTYKDVSPAYKTYVYDAYKLFENLEYWQTEVNPLKTTPDGKLEIEVYASYLNNSMYPAINSRYGEIHMAAVPIPEWGVDAMTINDEVYTTFERVANHYTRDQYQPYCSVEPKAINTFSDREYDYELTSSWHVVMADQIQEHGNWHKMAILARKQSQNHLEVYYSYKSETGKDLEIQIKPGTPGQTPHVDVKTNAQKICEGDLTTYWDDVAQIPLLEYYTQHGVLVLRISYSRIRTIYDGQRIVVLADDHRNTTRGICGWMTGDTRDDYLTPLGIVDRDDLFGASYALHAEQGDPQTKQLYSEAQKVAYQPRHVYTTILRSDPQWQQQSLRSTHGQNWGSELVYRTRCYNRQRGTCTIQQQVQYYETHGQICVTTSPLPACQSHCRGQEYTYQAAQVVCAPKVQTQYQTYKEQIRQGQNPTVTGVPQLKQFKVPTTCTA